MEHGPEDSPKRSLGDVRCIAEIISRFDVVALQEVKRDLAGLRLLNKDLGGNFDFRPIHQKSLSNSS